MATPVLTLRDLNRATLARQMLLAREEATLDRAVGKLVALQAQVARPPFVGLFARVEGLEREAIAQALHARTLVRGTSLRGTIHLMTATDFVDLRASILPALERGMKQILKTRLDGLDLDRWVLRGRAFFDEGPHTFDDFRNALAVEAPTLDIRAIAYLVRCRLPLVQIPTSDPWCFPASASFAVAETWLQKPIDQTKDDPRALVRRYLTAFGPGSYADAQTWSGRDGLRDVFESMRDELVVLQGPKKKEVFDLPDAPRPGGDADAPVRLLPEFDNLVLSHADRTRFVAAGHRKQVFLPALRVAATFLVDGFVAGAWQVERAKSKATLVLTPFAPLAKPVKSALEEEAERTLAFMEPSATSRDVRFQSG